MNNIKMSLETLDFPERLERPAEVYRGPYTVSHRQRAHFPALTTEYYC